MKYNSKQYGVYAAAALKALIQKAPFADVTGEYAEDTTNEKLDEEMKDLCRSAHGYAMLMVQTQKEFHNYLTSLP